MLASIFTTAGPAGPSSSHLPGIVACSVVTARSNARPFKRIVAVANLGRSRPEQDDRCASEADNCTHQIPPIGLCAFEQP